MDLRTILGLFALLCAAVASGILLIRIGDEEEQARETPRLGVGYYVTNAHLSGTGDDGRILYRLAAASVIQTPADGSVSLRGVVVNYDPAAEVPWSLTADTGRIPEGAKMIELTGNVVAATHETDNPMATIHTDYLEFDPATNIAATDREVVIEYAGSTVHAIGLRAMLRQDRLELLASVSGQYVR